MSPPTTAFWLILAAIALQRVAEVFIASRHERALRARGGRLVPGDRYPLIVASHAAFLVLMLVEHVVAPWAGPHLLTLPLLLAFLVGEGLRFAAMHALGDRWTTRVWTVPGEKRIERGIYRRLRHPNYVGVALGAVSLALAFGLPASALAMGAAQAWLLRGRIRLEESAFEESAREPAPLAPEQPA
ncbi:MAG TPA: isoprenylcysteine carboxylmethyltransferase family protein [Candidatus Thermoplasmatota archaeon]|nr:isoprenylcysteine carboxylmethyltransferase family protein [Candidatus Thermoplasmatota archaeon]